MRRIVLILSMTIFLGCSIKDNQNIDHECIFVDLADLKDIKINDLFLIDKIIKLETQPNLIIGNISEVITNQDHTRIFILDSRFTKSVYIFSFDGRHINTIKHSDIKDPFQPYYMRDIALDNTNNDLYILDAEKKRIFDFDTSGKTKNKYIDLKYPAQSIATTSNGDLLVLNKTSKFQKRPLIYSLERGKKFSAIGFNYYGRDADAGIFHREINNFYKADNGSVIFANYLTDTIYEVSSTSELKELLTINFVDRSAPESFFSSLENYDTWYDKLKNSEYAVKLGYFIYTNNRILFPFYLEKKGYMYYKNRSTKEVKIFDFPYFGINIPKIPVGFYNEGFILSLEANIAIEFCQIVRDKKYEMNSFEKNLLSYLTNLVIDKEDNQILIFVKVK